ncbi:hypothetical protein L1286_15065 [Pseudoalteromonas sp. SMS1]|uniref:hypothetical protein n=1 Tax=Pseudoalteromonas sp. SMS1 TaxID=2908894 RepID=UPI001F457D9C|nr:hypothetical protein [Pseudoalteromonas sp. SMS1]MCF2858805.1 hypothetical protein [Pseudoalteromonas sp. SMS1]
MKHIYFGLEQQFLSEVLHFIENSLKVSFVERESSYKGVYFKAQDAKGVLFELTSNFVEDQGEWQKPDFDEFDMLLKIGNLSVDKAGEIDFLDSYIYLTKLEEVIINDEVKRFRFKNGVKELVFSMKL